ncbi:mannose-6-phosphate isomerase-like protein (cupin superfamily) [Crossiella equi]|uniref:Mannose-6-phosphate isomerase-like protein (Cupin superfamily) n=1 Tax=Crossiella equi TaxID=130796 RepID=A0ABS5AKH4_9PSEU|nr:cysteine dioxygenase family protein [Crossiella equi]MBP2476877.1 mannose-6-phosphate isomerase-like protein (cupin superfamily) [Crossiella equi]
MTTSLTRPEIHPALDLPLLHDLLHPRRPLWTPQELRGLTSTVSGELTTPLLSVLEFDRERRWWSRLALTEGVELWLLSWAPGQGTRPHDHGGAAGSFTVLLGELEEDYRYPGGPVRTSTRSLGDTVAFGRGRAHRVHNTGTIGAASVHAYSPPLLPTTEYGSLEDYTAVPQPRRRVGENA